MGREWRGQCKGLTGGMAVGEGQLGLGLFGSKVFVLGLVWVKGDWVWQWGLLRFGPGGVKGNGLVAEAVCDWVKQVTCLVWADIWDWARQQAQSKENGP